MLDFVRRQEYSCSWIAQTGSRRAQLTANFAIIDTSLLALSQDLVPAIRAALKVGGFAELVAIRHWNISCLTDCKI